MTTKTFEPSTLKSGELVKHKHGEFFRFYLINENGALCFLDWDCECPEDSLGYYIFEAGEVRPVSDYELVKEIIELRENQNEQ